MSTLTTTSMHKNNAQKVKSGRVRNNRNKVRHCKTIGCPYFTKSTHCHGCSSGLNKKQACFKKTLETTVKTMTKDSEHLIGDTVIKTLVNLYKRASATGRITLFRAKDVAKFFHNDYQRSCLSYDFHLLSPSDKLLLHVADYWNLHQDVGFPSTVQCYWNKFHSRRSLENDLYDRRYKLFEKESFKVLLGPKHSEFIKSWEKMMKQVD